MRIVTVGLHHQVLTAWAEYRRTLVSAPAVLSFDFHTDVMRCFRGREPDPADSAWRSADAVADAVAKLRHDEHFDWALRGGVIGSAVIAALSPCAVAPEHEKLQVIRHPDLPEVDAMLNDPEAFRPLASSVLSDGFLEPLLADIMPEAGFILDVDCDYFMCPEALDPLHHEVFDTLVKRAGLVTVSLENDWVRLLRLPGGDFSGSLAAEILEERINALLAADR
jgi:hypothetical protein